MTRLIVNNATGDPPTAIDVVALFAADPTLRAEVQCLMRWRDTPILPEQPTLQQAWAAVNRPGRPTRPRNLCAVQGCAAETVAGISVCELHDTAVQP